ncbi:MAG: tRNA (5-methylaminomethyl-2-thiouridine)(34)-methyltransferase MnmD [Flavobacteriaceae bacterium]|nr:tRNA (5-methylaminomethyl-2-thiouridine)(34)-methyltransferase MnmD [Flavobacteriaceae bacterium]
MKRMLKTTADNSKTLYIEALDECYHSHHGALQEARHVFIKNGLNMLDFQEINILEMGFGTGLNVLVTMEEFLKSENLKIRYYSLEKYPIDEQEAFQLAYDELFENPVVKATFKKIHKAEWEKEVEIQPNFYLKKIKTDFFALNEIELPPIDLVYFDCFGARVQPDLWEKPLFELVSKKMKKGGLLTTYSSKGSVRRNLLELGFEVEKVEGPKGKREMINAILK